MRIYVVRGTTKRRLSVAWNTTLCQELLRLKCCPCEKSVPQIIQNVRQTRVRHVSPFRQLSLIRALEQKHSPLLLADEIKLSLERLPKSRTLTGKRRTIRSSECRVTFNYHFTGGSLISRCPFQGWKHEVVTSSPASPGQVLTWFSKSTTKQKD